MEKVTSDFFIVDTHAPLDTRATPLQGGEKKESTTKESGMSTESAFTELNAVYDAFITNSYRKLQQTRAIHTALLKRALEEAQGESQSQLQPLYTTASVREMDERIRDVAQWTRHDEYMEEHMRGNNTLKALVIANILVWDLFTKLQQEQARALAELQIVDQCLGTDLAAQEREFQQKRSAKDVEQWSELEQEVKQLAGGHATRILGSTLRNKLRRA